MANELDTFLAENAAQEPAQPPEPAPSPESPAKPEAAPTPSTAPAKAKESPKDDADDADTEPPAPQLGEAVVPRRALEDERHKRQDWKERAVKAETQHAELMRQLEEAKKAPPPAPVQQQPPPQMQPLPDPQQDPVGFARGFAIQQQQMLLNERLNMSEMMLREKLGPDKVDEYVNEFKSHAERDPTLFGKLYTQTNPYGWMTREVDRLRLMRDVGDDPAALRSRIEAEARAKWEQEAAERGPAIPQAAPVPGMQPSLANARSVASRTAPQWTGEPSLDDVLAPIQNRKSNGQFTRRF
jgi:hypothetical protein